MPDLSDRSGSEKDTRKPQGPRLRPWPDSLLARIVLVMAIGVVSAQWIGAVLLARQLRENASSDALSAGRYMALNAAGSIRFFHDLPPPFRAILIEQMRTMGGTRFFVLTNHARVPVTALAGNALADSVLEVVRSELVRLLATESRPEVQFAWPDGLQVSDDGRMVKDLPESWVEATLLIRPRPAPVLVIQAEFEKGHSLWRPSASSLEPGRRPGLGGNT